MIKNSNYHKSIARVPAIWMNSFPQSAPLPKLMQSRPRSKWLKQAPRLLSPARLLAKSPTILRGVGEKEVIVEAAIAEVVVVVVAVAGVNPQMRKQSRPRYKCRCKVKHSHSKPQQQRIKQRAPLPKNKLKERELKRKGKIKLRTLKKRRKRRRDRIVRKR